MQIPQTFRAGAQPAGARGQADGAGGASWLQAAGYAAEAGQVPGCGAEAGVQGTGRGWPLTLDLQDLVAEVGLEVEGAVGREHEPKAGGREGRRSWLGRGGHLGTPSPRPWSWVETQAAAFPPLTQGHLPLFSSGRVTASGPGPSTPHILLEASELPAPKQISTPPFTPSSLPQHTNCPRQPPPSGQQQAHQGQKRQ